MIKRHYETMFEQSKQTRLIFTGVLNHVDMNSEESILSYGIGLILLNIGM
ncbi:hypothetical protein [Nitrosopumilus sp.]|nr:hypothetical protein [Nitrosopumilus sp.]MCV0411173.1 hypothetical protein [Nitrosopumilus sp.]